MHPFPMKTENWKPLPVILDVTLLTALLFTGWTVIDSGFVLIFSGNLWGHDGSRRWHGLESIDKPIDLSRRNGDEQMVQNPAVVEKLHVVASTLQALLLSVSFIVYLTYQVNSEKSCLLFSATKYEEFVKIIFLLFLISHIPVTTACYPWEYDNNGVCCSLCSPELGLQLKQPCTTSHNTICEPKEGYYCIDGCQMARKHTECPPGEGVKEKGTPFKDTVCEACPPGTFSREASTTEECKNWTVCEMPKFKQIEPGSAMADVICEAVSNWSNVAVYVGSIVLVVILLGIVALVLWKRKHKTGNGSKQNTSDQSGNEAEKASLKSMGEHV